MIIDNFFYCRRSLSNAAYEYKPVLLNKGCLKNVSACKGWRKQLVYAFNSALRTHLLSIIRFSFPPSLFGSVLKSFKKISILSPIVFLI